MNHKQLLMDFYLKLLAIPATDRFRIKNQGLYAGVLITLSRLLDEESETVQRIFESMVQEDKNYGYTQQVQCSACKVWFNVGDFHECVR